MMKAIVITGAPGVGKSALLYSLAQSLPGRNAWLDGDHIALVRPFSRDVARQNLIQDNICACAKNFADWGADYFLSCWVWGNQERLDRLDRLLRAEGYTTHLIALVADETVLIDRHKKKGWEGCDHPDELTGLGQLDASIRQLKSAYILDTTHLTIDDVVRETMSYLNVQQGAQGDAVNRAP